MLYNGYIVVIRNSRCWIGVFGALLAVFLFTPLPLSRVYTSITGGEGSADINFFSLDL